MTTRTISAMFDSYSDARDAVTRLERAGIPHDDISIISNDASHKQYHSDDQGSGAGTGASLGTLIGGGTGLLAGLGLLAIPGLGPVVAAGWLASTALGAGIGAAAGGLVGSLTGAGIDESDAHAYAEGVRRGGTLVTVRADDAMAARAADILDDEGTIDMDEREQSWRSEGWTGGSTSTGMAGSSSTGVAGSMGAAGGSMSHGIGDAARGAGDTLIGDDAGTRTRAPSLTSDVGGTRTDAGSDDDMMGEENGERRRRVRIHSAGVRQPL